MADIRLRIELLGTDPLVWRRVVVPEQMQSASPPRTDPGRDGVGG